MPGSPRSTKTRLWPSRASASRRSSASHSARRPTSDGPSTSATALTIADADGARQTSGRIRDRHARELAAGGDAELGEDLAHVPLDRALAQEQLRPDLRVRHAVACHAGDLRLLRSELVARLDV